MSTSLLAGTTTVAEARTVAEALRAAVEALRRAAPAVANLSPEKESELANEWRFDAELLLAHALQNTRISLFMDPKRVLSEDEAQRFSSLIERRVRFEPVAYLLGEREFYGRPFAVDPRVLIPRPDTEVLVEVGLAALAKRSREASTTEAPRVLDLCTGSGAVAISIAKEVPRSEVLGTDVSEPALEVARENARLLDASNAIFALGDLFHAVDAASQFDLILANPPYIRNDERPTLSQDILAHEPHVALFGGDEGLEFYRRIVDEAPAFLAPGAMLAVEVGHEQGDAVAELFVKRGFREVTRTKDLQKIDRVISGIRRE